MSEKKIVLVRNGVAEATVVVASDLGKHSTAAVADLVRVVGIMTSKAPAGGAALPVVDDGAVRGNGPQIHVGRTAYVREQNLVPDDLPVNGFRLATLFSEPIQRIVIAGRHDLGTSHGVYTFLSDVLGVVWGMADPRFEDIPSHRTIEVGFFDRTERPVFGFRVFSGNHADWVRRNRVDDGSRVLPYYGHGHNLFSIIPPSKFGDQPDLYAMLPPKGEKGPLERRVPEKDGHTHIQPCLTNPKFIKLTIDHVRKFYDDNPEISTFSLCPNDSGDFCQCPDCLALDNGMPEYRGRRMTSDSYFYYIDAVSKELIKTHPDRYVGVYAYWTTELPPRNIKRLRENVVVYLTQDSSQYHDPAYEKRDHELLESWSKVAHHLAVYDYYGLGWFTPRVYPHIVGRTVPYLPTVSVKGFYNETYPYWAHTGPQLYLVTRLFWDASLDTDAVLDEYYNRMYREAAGEMKRFYEILERGWTAKREGRWFQGLDWLSEQIKQVPADARDEAFAQINRALAAATSDVVRDRISYVLDGHRLAYLFSKTFEEVHALTADQSDLSEAVMHIVDRVAEAERLYRTKIETDQYYGHAYYRGERGEVQIRWWMAHIASVIEDKIGRKRKVREALNASPTWHEMVASKDLPDIPRRLKESRSMWNVK